LKRDLEKDMEILRKRTKIAIAKLAKDLAEQEEMSAENEDSNR